MSSSSWPTVLGGANSNEYSSKSSGEATKLGRSDMQLDQVFMEGEQTKFVVTQKNYTKQFASIYYNRLELLRPCVEQSVERAIGKVVSQSLLSRVMNLERGKDCILCGTLYKDMKLKPCILDEYADENLGAEEDEEGEGVGDSAAFGSTGRSYDVVEKFLSGDDSIVLEVCVGQKQIMEYLMNTDGATGLKAKKTRHAVKSMDVQPSAVGNGILIMITGEMLIDDEKCPLKFGQVFHLAPADNTGKSYFIFNDIFRFNYG